MLLLLLCLLPALGARSYSSLSLTGDVNLNPDLKQLDDPLYVWGDTLPFLRRSGALFAINHESTLAGIPLADPDVIQFEDPLNYTRTYGAAGVGFLSAANNHQNDFRVDGLLKSVANMDALGIPWAGLSRTAEEARRPRVVGNVAFFTLVVDECAVWPNGTLYLDACTCGDNAGKQPPYQCYAAGSAQVPYGLWYSWGITDAFIAEVASTLAKFRAANPALTVVTFLHAGPNFQWQPSERRTQLLRNVSESSDVVWCTSSHHVQGLEARGDSLIIYGMGDFLFRHVVGVEDFCPLDAVPCQAYRPDIAMSYNVGLLPSGRVDFDAIQGMATSHDNFRTTVLQDARDLLWTRNILRELSPTMNVSVSKGFFEIKRK